MSNAGFGIADTLVVLAGLLRQYWLVPAGMVFLYFYGTWRFNTPDYDMTPEELGGGPRAVRLITLAPPIFTTTRSRFRRYSLRYVAILELMFCIAILDWHAVATGLAVLGGKPGPGHGDGAGLLADPTDIERQAIWALFAITGILSSFPGVKDLDVWLLKKLHHAALIPDNAKLVAEQLFSASYAPAPAAAEKVRAMLTMRDTIRAAKGTASGSLEQTILRTLWLKVSLEEACARDSNMAFRGRVQRDLTDINEQAKAYIADVRRYLAVQEKVVPEAVIDIDAHLDGPDVDPMVKEQLSRRQELTATCEGLLRRLCLLTALFINATTFDSAEATRALRDIGFGIVVQPRPIWHMEALVKLVLATFFAVFVYFTAMATLYRWLGLFPEALQGRPPGRAIHLALAASTTIGFAVALMIAVAIKRQARSGNDRRQQNYAIGLIAYLAVVPLSLAALLVMPMRQDGSLERATLFALAQFTPGVAGYFFATYVDRAIAGLPLSRSLLLQQGAAQTLAAFATHMVLPDPPFEMSALQQGSMYVFFALQNGLTGVVTGFIVQRFYRLGDLQATQPGTDVSIIGGLALRRG